MSDLVEALRQEIREDGRLTRDEVRQLADRVKEVEVTTRQGYKIAVTNQTRIDQIEARHDREDGKLSVMKAAMGAAWAAILALFAWVLTKVGG